MTDEERQMCERAESQLAALRVTRPYLNLENIAGAIALALRQDAEVKRLKARMDYLQSVMRAKAAQLEALSRNPIPSVLVIRDVAETLRHIAALRWEAT